MASIPGLQENVAAPPPPPTGTPWTPWIYLQGSCCEMFSSSIRRRADVSGGLYPAHYYRVLTEFGGPRISPITLAEQHLTTLMEHLPKLCEAMCRGERSACKDGVFGLMYSGGTNSVARMYQDTRYIILNLVIYVT
jgi:hypothetical protein